MIGMLAAIAGTFGLLFMCASITKENTERAVRKHHESWE
jgi:hypothetical protein